MDHATEANETIKELAEVTNTPIETLESLNADDLMQDALVKFTRNLTKCLKSFTENITGDVKTDT